VEKKSSWSALRQFPGHLSQEDVREQNEGGKKIEKATFWNNAFGVGDCRFCSNDGTGIY
jgi:hypothetical protein